MFQVKKKDGSLEPFDRSKIVNGVLNAGGTPEDAEKVAADVEAWLPTVAVDGVVSSSDIKTKGLESLGMVNPAVAATFASYQKPTVA